MRIQPEIPSIQMTALYKSSEFRYLMLPTTRKRIVYIMGGLAAGLVCNGAPGLSWKSIIPTTRLIEFCA